MIQNCWLAALKIEETGYFICQSAFWRHRLQPQITETKKQPQYK